MKALLLLFLFTIAYRIYAVCPNGTFSNVAGDKCYFIPNDTIEFVLAEINCKKQNGDLASISNAFDNMALTADAKNLLGSNVTYVWLGGSNVNNGTWIWTDGQPFSYTNWAKRNPDNHTGDNCLALNPSNGLWHSHNCYKTIPYICELSQTNCPTCPPCPQTTCPPCQSHCEISCPDSWVYNSKTGFCYKVVYIYQNNYTYSESVCEQHDGHLASIHSSDENSFILNLHSGIFPYIGLYYDNKTNAFLWSDNTPVNYTNFYPNDTNSYPTGYCVIQESEEEDEVGMWHIRNCSWAQGFVCKTRPQIWQNNTLEYKIKDSAFINITEDNKQTKPIYSEQNKCSNTCPTCVPDSCTPCPTLSICNTKCPDGWTYYSATNFCYKNDPNFLTFSNAEQTCQQSNGHLISIHNENETNFLGQFVATYSAFWIGLSYNVSLSNFTWTDNTPYDYSFWDAEQPDIASNQYCIINEGFIGISLPFIWWTDVCTNTFPFVCKKPPNF